MIRTHSDTSTYLVGSAPTKDGLRPVAEELPVGLLYNGVPHVVLMATPADVEDLATGFSLTDGVCQPSEIRRIDVREQDAGLQADMTLAPAALNRFLKERRTRNQRSFTSCGVCGIVSTDRLPPVAPDAVLGGAAMHAAAVRTALASLPDHQLLNRLTGAVHAAAWALPDGTISLVREDVGRHNALDKLIGAMGRTGALHGDGFCIITSRCSYEMVQKAVAAGFGLLVAISAPTALAVREARQAGLTLVALARSDTQTVYAGHVDSNHPAAADRSIRTGTPFEAGVLDATS